MERVEIVFGNLTNMELLSGKASPSSSVQKTTTKSSEINEDEFCAPRMHKMDSSELLNNRQNSIINSSKGYANSVRSKYARVSGGGSNIERSATTNGTKNFGQLSTQELLRATNNTRCFLTKLPESLSHCRSKTMPEIHHQSNCCGKA